MSRLSANLLLLLAGAIWGMGFVAQQTAMENLGPFGFIALRFLVASIVLLPFVWRECNRPKQPLPDLLPVHFVQFISIGLCLFTGMAAQQVGLLTITVTSSGFLTGLYVVFTPFLAVVLFKQWPHPVIWPATLIAMTGIFLLSGGNLSSLARGDFLTVFSAVCWALQVVLIGRFVGRTNRPLTLSLVQFMVTCLLASIAAVMFETMSVAGIKSAVFEILYTGIFATGIAFSLQVIGQRYTTAPQAAIFLSSESLFAALFGAIVLGERIGWVGLSGCALIFTAMLLVELVPELQKYKSKKAKTKQMNADSKQT